MKTSNEYQEKAEKFLRDCGGKLSVKYESFGPYFPSDKESREIYRFRISRNGRSYSARFGQSIANAGQEPTAYDVLTCLTKSDPGTFEDFCGEYGYDTDSRTAERTYKAVVKQWAEVKRVFGDVIDELQEIQ